MGNSIVQPWGWKVLSGAKGLLGAMGWTVLLQGQEALQRDWARLDQ